MSVVVEYHQCRMVVHIPERPLAMGTWRCTHVNLDGESCHQVISGYGEPGFPSASHVTSSEAITARIKAEVLRGPEG